MWLWADPPRKRSGAASVWADHASLRAFVGRPDHLRTVRAHRGRGTMRATVWTADRLDPESPWATAQALLADPAPWPTAWENRPVAAKEAGAS